MKYLKCFILIVIASLLGGLLKDSIAQTNLAMLYILVVVITAVRWGRGPSFMASVLSVMMFDFFFVPPYLSFTVADTQYLIAFATLFIVGTVISTLTLKSREQAEAAKNRELQTLALYKLSRDLGNVLDIASLCATVRSHMNTTFNAETAVLLYDPDGSRRDFAGPEFPRNDTEDAAANTSYTTGKPAGWSTRVAHKADAYYLPLKTSHKAFGVLGVKFNMVPSSLSGEHLRLIETFGNQIASAIERLKLSGEAHQASLLREREKLHTSFLNSLSHDLRTPLASISGSLDSILNSPGIEESIRLSLIETAYEEADRLNQLVGDLLDMARIDSGALRLQKKPADMRDVVGAAVKQVDAVLRGYEVHIAIPHDIPEVEIDFILVMKVLANILDNAAKNSPQGSAIEVTVTPADTSCEIAVSDKGKGIPDSNLKLIFDKFYRVKRSNHYDGTGLGLSVCKGIIEAHRGAIWAENRKNGGTVIRITIPYRGATLDDND